jgi:MFS family permease
MCPYHAISKDKSLKRLLIVNFLYSFLAAAMAVLVPLYLIDNEFDLTQIGILLAIAPLTFAILRINFASIADEFGTKLIDILYSVSGLLSIAIYVASSTVFAIAIAILGESIRTSAFWAVVRTEIIYGTNNPKGALAFFSGIRQFADAFGRIAIGFILAVFAFQNSFLLLGLISLILLYLAFSSIDNKHKPIQSINYGRDIFKKIGYPHPATF